MNGIYATLANASLATAVQDSSIVQPSSDAIASAIDGALDLARAEFPHMERQLPVWVHPVSGDQPVFTRPLFDAMVAGFGRAALASTSLRERGIPAVGDPRLREVLDQINAGVRAADLGARLARRMIST